MEFLKCFQNYSNVYNFFHTALQSSMKISKFFALLILTFVSFFRLPYYVSVQNTFSKYLFEPLQLVFRIPTGDSMSTPMSDNYPTPQFAVTLCNVSQLQILHYNTLMKVLVILLCVAQFQLTEENAKNTGIMYLFDYAPKFEKYLSYFLYHFSVFHFKTISFLYLYIEFSVLSFSFPLFQSKN